MTIQQVVVGSSVVFTVSGAYTHRDAGALRTTVDRALQGGVRDVVLDLEGVSDIRFRERQFTQRRAAQDREWCSRAQLYPRR